MTLKFGLFMAALAGILACVPAGAQVRSGETPVHQSAVHVKPAAKASAKSAGSAAAKTQARQQSSVIQISPSGQVSSVIAPSSNYLGSSNFSGVPGLGFDFPHLAALG